MVITMLPRVRDFGKDKDMAAYLREYELRSALARGESVTLDFSGINLVTQPFIHALINDILRKNGEQAPENLEFKMVHL